MAGAEKTLSLASISIIIPALDEAANLARLLPGLVASSPAPEVIVVDGGSGDGTADVVSASGSVQFLAGARGRARQMNAGARVASGQILLFLHADTRLPHGALDAVTRAMVDPAVVGGRFDVRFDTAHPTMGMVAWFINRRSRLSGIATGDQAIFVRRTAFEALGGYPDIPLMEDVELSRRLKRHGHLACLRETVTTSARKWQREGVLRTILLMWGVRFLHFCGVSPTLLHRLYYGRLAPVD
jgi:rSAM/selenodomain-associated transferase 2